MVNKYLQERSRTPFFFAVHLLPCFKFCTCPLTGLFQKMTAFKTSVHQKTANICFHLLCRYLMVLLCSKPDNRTSAFQLKYNICDGLMYCQCLLKSQCHSNFVTNRYGLFDSKPLTVESCSVGISLACTQLKGDSLVIKQCSHRFGMYVSKQDMISNNGAMPVA